MVKVCQEYFPDKGGFYLDSGVKKTLDYMKKRLKKDWDNVIVFDGKEGVGKSVFAMQWAFYLDNNFCLDRVTYCADDFINCCANAKKYQTVMLDESFNDFGSSSVMSQTNKRLKSLLMEIRQKNLNLIIVLPSFFHLDQYAAIHRSSLLVHVVTSKDQRGYFKIYGENGKKVLHLVGKKKAYDYKVARPMLKGRFTNFYTLDQTAYKEKKSQVLKRLDKLNDDQSKEETYSQKLRSKLLYHFTKDLTVKERENILNSLNMSKTYINKFLMQYRKENKLRKKDKFSYETLQDEYTQDEKKRLEA
jgi:hypothetical protein